MPQGGREADVSKDDLEGRQAESRLVSSRAFFEEASRRPERGTGEIWASYRFNRAIWGSPGGREFAKVVTWQKGG
jgi:hypothetical protein